MTRFCNYIGFLVLCVIACAIPRIGLSQADLADVKMKEIESFRKFKVEKPFLPVVWEITKETLDTTIRVLDLATYTRKKDGLSKVVQRSRYQGTEVKRTCYFNEVSKLFAIRDSIWYDNHTTRQLTYYFKAGKLQRAMTSKNEDVTENINQTELFYWLKNMFDDLTIE